MQVVLPSLGVPLQQSKLEGGELGHVHASCRFAYMQDCVSFL